MSEKNASSKEIVIVDAEWSETDDSDRVRVMSGSERYSYDGETINQRGERVSQEETDGYFRPHVYVVKSSSSLLTKLAVALAAVAILWFIVFVALPLGIVFVAIAAAAWYLRSWWQKYM